MAALVIGAIALGSLSSWVLSFVPFFLAVVTAIVVGACTLWSRGVPISELPLPGLALLVMAQVAYGLGLLAQVGLSGLIALGQRRTGASVPAFTSNDQPVHKGKPIEPNRHPMG